MLSNSRTLCNWVILFIYIIIQRFADKMKLNCKLLCNLLVALAQGKWLTLPPGQGVVFLFSWWTWHKICWPRMSIITLQKHVVRISSSSPYEAHTHPFFFTFKIANIWKHYQSSVMQIYVLIWKEFSSWELQPYVFDKYSGTLLQY